MAILFDWYENPKTSEQQGKRICCIRVSGNTAQLRLRLNNREEILYIDIETDVMAVLDALSHAMGEELAEGRQVHLDGIGFSVPIW